jgi:protein-S-isoprenylcysteine O-methyltransferase Ste14
MLPSGKSTDTDTDTDTGMMGRILAVLGSALFLPIAPGVVAGLVPWWISKWKIHPPLFGFRPVRVFGFLLIVTGVSVLVESFARFALEGLGTPAIVFPPRRLVVKGLYRHVRNPMYLAVVAIIVGEAMILGNLNVLKYAALVWLFCHLFVLAYEEPTLRKTFGAEYNAFCVNVPRWTPRLRPWNKGPTNPPADSRSTQRHER